MGDVGPRHGLRVERRRAARRLTVSRVQHELRAAKERERTLVVSGEHGRVPDVRRAAEVDGASLAPKEPLASRAQEVRLQLDRGEAGRAVWEVRDARIPHARVGERHDRACVEVPVRSKVLGPQLQLGSEEAVSHLGNHDADELGEVTASELVEELGVEVEASFRIAVLPGGRTTARRYSSNVHVGSRRADRDPVPCRRQDPSARGAPP